MKTFGVYGKDLGVVWQSGLSLESARRCAGVGKVVCSEKYHWFGIRIKFQVDFLPRFWRLGWKVESERFFLGPFSFAFERIGHKWADKIVEDGQ